MCDTNLGCFSHGEVSKMNSSTCLVDFQKAYSNRPDQGPEVIKLFSCSTQPVTYTQLSTKVQLLVKTKVPTIEEVFALDLLDVVFIMLINAKSILTFMSRINFVLS